MESDKEENMEVTAAIATSCLKRRSLNFLSNVIFAQSMPGRRPNDKYPVNT